MAVVIPPFGKDVPPAAGHFIVRPTGCDIGPVADHQVDVVAHNRKTKDIDGEMQGQAFEALLEPFFAMVEALARDIVGAAQESAPHATIDAVIDADFGRIEHELTGNARH